MKWQLTEPAYGDMIRVKLGDIYHYGIYVTDDEVIQFGLAPSCRPTLKDSDIHVLSSDVDTFLAGGFLEVAVFDRKERRAIRKPEEVVTYARSKMGTAGYNIIHNNCEHFVNECVRGVSYSSQADDVRAMFRSLPVVDVYFGRIPEKGKFRPLIPKEREEELGRVSNERVRREKYYVWRLLEYALERSFGLRMKKLTVTKEPSGRWTTPSCEFSLSHSDGLVAVAVSRAAVGIDVEGLTDHEWERLSQRFLSDEERVTFETLLSEEKNIYLVKKWTAKEAAFKFSHKEAFDIAEDTVNVPVKSDVLTVGEKTYLYSVATETPERIRIYRDIDLEKL